MAGGHWALSGYYAQHRPPSLQWQGILPWKGQKRRAFKNSEVDHDIGFMALQIGNMSHPIVLWFWFSALP